MPPYNYCAVDGCKSQKNNRSLSFFTLPVNEIRRKRWLEVIGRPDLDNPKTNPKCYFVCCLHFEKYMITSKPILRLDAEPVKFLPNQAKEDISNEEFKEVSTQTDSYLNGLPLNNDGHTFPEVPIVKQEPQDETILQTIKQEYVEVETAPATTQEDTKDIHTEDIQTPVATKRPRGKTKEPRKIRKIKRRNDE